MQMVSLDAWLAKGYQVRRGQRDNWLRVTLPTAMTEVLYARSI